MCGLHALGAVIGSRYLEGNKNSKPHLQWDRPPKCPIFSFWKASRTSSGGDHCTGVAKLSPATCPFEGRKVSWVPGKYMPHGLFPPSAGVGYQPDVILWHRLLWPASRGSSQHYAWEIQATSQHGRSLNTRSRDLPGLPSYSLLPSHTAPQQDKAMQTSYNSYRKEGKRTQLISVHCSYEVLG